MFALILAGQLALASPAVIDGDTLRAGGETYRLAEVDTPETLRSRCPAERQLGEAAAARLAGLLESASVIEARPAWNPRGRKKWPTDGFGRRIARVSVDGKDVGELLVAEGMAAPYSGRGVRPDWCAGR